MIFRLVAIILALLSFHGVAYSITTELATKQWNLVKGTSSESTFLINLFLYEKLSGSFPHTIKKRFYEIASKDDAKILLDNLLNPRFRKKLQQTLF
jgi:hypothetical protein